jgi:hypothetical protein
MARLAKPRVVMLHVRRACLVCDWVGELDEPEATDEVGGVCPECHAPTERRNILDRRVVAIAANPAAVELGRRGGLKGGPARAAKLSAARRTAIARAAARARWRR